MRVAKINVAIGTVVSDTVWQPSSRINFLDGTPDGGLDVVKCTFTTQVDRSEALGC